jgi:RNA polymerase sigma-70 factor, ECF subfamily
MDGHETNREREARFDLLYRNHKEIVEKYTQRRLTPQLAEEATADTFTILWTRLESVPADSLPWILATARNVCKAKLRQELRFSPTVLRDDTQVIGDHAETVATILDALSNLSEEDREVLILTSWDGLAPSVAAKVVGCSRTAFGVRLFRARRRLEASLSTTSLKEGQL